MAEPVVLHESPPGTAWDGERPPSAALIGDCVHCGFCLPACPTYSLWHEEMDSPRGRIQLMDLGYSTPALSEEMVSHFDKCLGCMACVPACPSGVRYDLLLLETRPQIERNFKRTLSDRAFRRLIFALFPHPARLRALVPFLILQRRLRLGSVVPRRFRRLRAMAALSPPVGVSATWRTLPSVTPAVGTKRGTVAILQGCVQRVFFAGVNSATIEVLAAEGFEVHAPRGPRCCGSLQQHTGYEEEARACARETVAAFAGYDTVVVNAAGCGSGMKEYGHLIGAGAFAAKVKDVHEFLAGVEPRAPRHPLPLRAVYHDACHLAHAQGIREQPRALLAGIPGLELLTPAQADRCCGSAGVYNLLEPEAAAELGRSKAAALQASGAEAVVSANPGCSIQISQYMNPSRPVYHPIELLALSLRGRQVGSGQHHRP
jgi:glycolate oxidase iron-sulfur subunit